MVCQIRLAGFPHFVQRVCELRLPTVLDDHVSLKSM